MTPELRETIAQGRGVPVRLLADAVGVTPTTIYALVQRGELRAYRIGEAVRIVPTEAARLLGLEQAEQMER